MRPSCLGRLFVAAFALVATAGLVTPAHAVNGTGTWVITSPAQTGTNPLRGGPPCWQYTTQAGGGYMVEPGGTYTISLTHVTECGRSPSTLWIQFQSSTGGNYPVNGPMQVTGSAGVFSFTFTVPSSFCNTGVIGYRCTSGGANIIAVGHMFAAAFDKANCGTPIQLTDTNGCGTNIVTLTCPASITNACVGQTVHFCFDPNGTTNSVPNVTGGHSPYTVLSVSAQTTATPPASVTVTPSGTNCWDIGPITVNTTVTIKVGDSSEPQLTGTCTFGITANPLPDCTITGPSAVCAGSLDNSYSVTDASNQTYAWSVTGGTATIHGSSTGSSVNVNAGTGTYTVYVTVTNTATGCTNTCHEDVTVNALPDCTITGDGAVCAVSTGNTYSVTAAAGLTYLWSVSGDGATIDGDNTGSSVTVNAGTGNYTVTVTVTNTATTCSNTCHKEVTVTSCNTGCTLTIGGYRNHFSGLVSSLTGGAGLTLGGQRYSVADLNTILAATGSTCTDQSLLVMTQQLITATLNNLKNSGGAPSDCIAEGNAILATFTSKVCPVGTASAGPDYDGSTGTTVSTVINCLNAYNTSNECSSSSN
jgi:hypothetical protein